MFLQSICASLKHRLVNLPFRKFRVEICCCIKCFTSWWVKLSCCIHKLKKKKFISTCVQNFYYLLPLRLTSQFHRSYSDHHCSVQYLSIKYKLWHLMNCVEGSHPRKFFTHSKRIQWKMSTYKLLYVSVRSCAWCIRNHCGRVKLMKHRQDNTYYWSQPWHINALDMMLIPDLARVFRSCRLPVVIRKTLWWMLHPVILSICCLCLFPLSVHH